LRLQRSNYKPYYAHEHDDAVPFEDRANLLSIKEEDFQRKKFLTSYELLQEKCSYSIQQTSKCCGQKEPFLSFNPLHMLRFKTAAQTRFLSAYGNSKEIHNPSYNDRPNELQIRSLPLLNQLWKMACFLGLHPCICPYLIAKIIRKKLLTPDNRLLFRIMTMSSLLL
jgi:hypothetical protein